ATTSAVAACGSSTRSMTTATARRRRTPPWCSWSIISTRPATAGGSRRRRAIWPPPCRRRRPSAPTRSATRAPRRRPRWAGSRRGCRWWRAGRGGRGWTGLDGAGVQRLRYDAYGNRIDSSGAALTNLLYNGEELDAATGQYYFRARYYDPIHGRFMQQDS